ncbi:hypothetical protein TWF128_000468 [Orbilia oligospora]|nr:hypothetical protein TWF128_000468 [Orbilia oligospora]
MIRTLMLCEAMYTYIRIRPQNLSLLQLLQLTRTLRSFPTGGERKTSSVLWQSSQTGLPLQSCRGGYFQSCRATHRLFFPSSFSVHVLAKAVEKSQSANTSDSLWRFPDQRCKAATSNDINLLQILPSQISGYMVMVTPIASAIGKGITLMNVFQHSNSSRRHPINPITTPMKAFLFVLAALPAILAAAVPAPADAIEERATCPSWSVWQSCWNECKRTGRATDACYACCQATCRPCKK